MRPLTTDLQDPDSRPYFLWDEDLSVREFRARLQDSDASTRLHALAKLLREARDTDVWSFVTPQEVASALPAMERKLGRRRAFWTFLIEGWRRLGILER